MASVKKIIAVVGATGNQGSSVVKTFVDLPGWHVRAITRNPASEKAEALVSLGAEAVQADLSDVESLYRAFEGANAIFVNTDFWYTYVSKMMAGTDGEVSAKAAYEVEMQHAKNAATAASRIVTLERYIYSALGPMKRGSGGKYSTYHWEGKADSVDYIEKEMPELAKKASFIYLGAYSTNAFLLPKLNPTSGEFEVVLPTPDSTKFPIIDPIKSTGPFVRALVEDEEPGVKLLAYDSYHTARESMDIWSRTSGKPTKFVQMTLEEMNKAIGLPFEVLYGASFIYEFGYTAGLENVVDPKQLKNKPATPSYEEWLKTQSTDYLLGGKYPRVEEFSGK